MIAGIALDTGPDVEKIKAAKVGSVTANDAINRRSPTIGENMTLRRAAQVAVSQGVVGSYVHNPGRRRARQDRRHRRPRSPGQYGRTRRARPSRSPCTSRPPNPRPSIRPGSSRVVAREKDILADKFPPAGQARDDHRQDRRVRPQDLLQGSLPARAALHPRRRQDGRAGGEGGRGQGRRADQGRRASCDTRSAKGIDRQESDFAAEVAAAAGHTDDGRGATAYRPAKRSTRRGRGMAAPTTAASSSSSPAKRWSAPRDWHPSADHRPFRRRHRRGARLGRDDRRSWSAAATSCAASRSPPRACRAPPPTPWACWRR